MKRALERQSLSWIKQSVCASFYSIAENETSSATMHRLNFFSKSTGGNVPKGTSKAQRIDPRRKNGAVLAGFSAKAEKAATVSKAKTEGRLPPGLGFGQQTLERSIVQRVERKTESRDGATGGTKTGLRALPGVGPKNEELLLSKGHTTVAELRSVFQEDFKGDNAKFVAYLQKEVGIMHRNHCESIVNYLSQPKPKKNKERITISVEGNISSGKSTFLEMLQDSDVEIRHLCEVVQEPVHEWQCVGGDKEFNLLERFYHEPEKYAYEFQNYVFLTRLNANRKTFEGDKPLRILERSVFSDRMVFVRAVHESKLMNDLELRLYDSWFNPLLKEVPGLIPDGFIYLRARPTTCMTRLKRRMRSEEVNVTDSYLEGLHTKHEDWFSGWKEHTSTLLLGERQDVRLSTHECNGWSGIEIPEELRGSIVWLGTSGILSQEPTLQNGNGKHVEVPQEVKEAMSQVPALILDCDIDINVESDIEAKREYARKVQLYFEFVRSYRQQQRVIRPFYNWTLSEELRLRWKLVNGHSVQELQELASKA